MAKMRFDVITAFPEFFPSPLNTSLLAKALKKELFQVFVHGLRKFGIGRHKEIDDRPFGGGPGMVLRVDSLANCLKSIFKETNNKKVKPYVVLLDPAGSAFNQPKAKKLAKKQHLILVCGHYEGVDERFKKLYVDEEISIGDFVVTGGEIPAMLIVDAVTRLQIGVLKQKVIEIESFSPLLEYPQYTRPEIYKNISVPKVLTRGNHKKILDWRNKTSIKKTSTLRPDIIKSIINPQRD